MPPKSKTLIVVIVDESGSMELALKETISGFNTFLESVQKEQPKAVFTLVQFNGQGVKTLAQGVPVGKMTAMTHESYMPNGFTPLYDAIGQTVRDVEQAGPAYDVLVNIITDGAENSSREFTTLEQIKALIQRKETDGWTFTYLAANQDAWAVGGSLGMAKGNIAAFDPQDPQAAFRNMAQATSNYASGRTSRRSLYNDPNT